MYIGIVDDRRLPSWPRNAVERPRDTKILRFAA
jgi:hypothetical protein